MPAKRLETKVFKITYRKYARSVSLEIVNCFFISNLPPLKLSTMNKKKTVKTVMLQMHMMVRARPQSRTSTPKPSPGVLRICSFYVYYFSCHSVTSCVGFFPPRAKSHPLRHSLPSRSLRNPRLKVIAFPSYVVGNSPSTSSSPQAKVIKKGANMHLRRLPLHWLI